MTIAEKILNAIPDNDYTTINSSSFRKIINECDFDAFQKGLELLYRSGFIYFDYGNDGIKIFKY